VIRAGTPHVQDITKIFNKGTLYGHVELAHAAQHAETSFTAGTIKGRTYLYDFGTIADNTLVSFCFEKSR
jgi:hypothetical protein